MHPLEVSVPSGARIVPVGEEGTSLQSGEEGASPRSGVLEKLRFWTAELYADVQVLGHK